MLGPEVQALFDDRATGDAARSYPAFCALMALAEKPVPWAYAVWDDLVAGLASPDNHQRAFAAQLLARLALSDPEGRMLTDFDAVAGVMRDERFVTARHTVQSIWRVGLAGAAQRDLVLAALETWFQGCVTHKNMGLIRTDIVTSLGHLAAALGAEHGAAVEHMADTLMAAEPDEKARKKQKAAWRKAAGSTSLGR